MMRRGISLSDTDIDYEKIPKQITKMKMRGESLSDNDWPRLEQLVLDYGGSQWSSDWIPGVKFLKQIIMQYSRIVWAILASSFGSLFGTEVML